MNSLINKHVLLGVTGGIAAYKSADLIRRLQDQGASVRVVMTRAAQEFITPLTLQALSGNPVHTDLLDPAAEAAMGHIELARWGDIILIAPASADFLARLAQGKGDDLLTTVCLAARSPIAVAPAMNQAMWASPATADNLALLEQRGIHRFGPAEGEQACGDVGLGRMLEPLELVAATAALFDTGVLAGKRVVITAGPTREPIDPVRYITNHSSGKMGYALAEAAIEAGAKVTLITGPVSLSAPERCSTVAVNTACEMADAALSHAEDCDIFIAAAAVADFRPIEASDQKIKKTPEQSHLTLELTKNPDIIAEVAALQDGPFTVGFAAETQNLIANARSKLERKQLQMIIANDVSEQGIGFNSDDNACTLITHRGEEKIERCGKSQLARLLIDRIAAISQT